MTFTQGVIRVPFGVSSSRKILSLWIRGLQHPNLADVQTAAGKWEKFHPPDPASPEEKRDWDGEGWDGSLSPTGLDHLPWMLISADAAGAAERRRCFMEGFGMEGLELRVIP